MSREGLRQRELGVARVGLVLGRSGCATKDVEEAGSFSIHPYLFLMSLQQSIKDGTSSLPCVCLARLLKQNCRC